VVNIDIYELHEELGDEDYDLMKNAQEEQKLQLNRIKEQIQEKYKSFRFVFNALIPISQGNWYFQELSDRLYVPWFLRKGDYDDEDMGDEIGNLKDRLKREKKKLIPQFHYNDELQIYNGIRINKY
jgi:hypothetical protein